MKAALDGVVIARCIDVYPFPLDPRVRSLKGPRASVGVKDTDFGAQGNDRRVYRTGNAFLHRKSACGDAISRMVPGLAACVLGVPGDGALLDDVDLRRRLGRLLQFRRRLLRWSRDDLDNRP